MTKSVDIAKRRTVKRNEIPQRGYTLLSYLKRYFNDRDLTPDYRELTERRLGKFVTWYGSDPRLSKLNCDDVNQFLSELLEAGATPYTVDNYRRAIKAVWSSAYVDGLAPNSPDRLKKVKVPRSCTHAFTHEEIARMLQYAATLEDYFPNGACRGDFWTAAINAAYSTGLRRGDLLTVRRDQIDRNGLATIVMSKTGYPVIVQFNAEAMAAIARMANVKDARALRWPYHANALSRQFRAIAKGAGVRRGQFKWLRRSCGSYCEREQPGAGSASLGHRSPAVFHAHYADHSITRGKAFAPPPIMPVSENG